jgi:hypothetical protein
MPKHKSISQRLSTAKTLETKQEILRDWAQAWDREVSQLLNDMGRAVAQDDFDRASQCIGELRAVHDKKIEGLGRILERVESIR